MFCILYLDLKENHLTQNKKIDFSLMKQKESIKSEYHWLIKRWLDKLCECGKLVSTNEDVYELKSDNINEKVKIYRESLYSTWNNEIMPETFILYIEENLKQISGLLSGKVNPVDILYPYGEWKIVRDLYINSKVSHYINSCIEELIQNMLSYNNERTIRILEIGAGTGAVLEKYQVY